MPRPRSRNLVAFVALLGIAALGWWFASGSAPEDRLARESARPSPGDVAEALATAGDPAERTSPLVGAEPDLTRESSAPRVLTGNVLPDPTGTEVPAGSVHWRTPRGEAGVAEVERGGSFAIHLPSDATSLELFAAGPGYWTDTWTCALEDPPLPVELTAERVLVGWVRFVNPDPGSRRADPRVHDRQGITWSSFRGPHVETIRASEELEWKLTALGLPVEAVRPRVGEREFLWLVHHRDPHTPVKPLRLAGCLTGFLPFEAEFPLTPLDPAGAPRRVELAVDGSVRWSELTVRFEGSLAEALAARSADMDVNVDESDEAPSPPPSPRIVPSPVARLELVGEVHGRTYRISVPPDLASLELTAIPQDRYTVTLDQERHLPRSARPERTLDLLGRDRAELTIDVSPWGGLDAELAPGFTIEGRTALLQLVRRGTIQGQFQLTHGPATALFVPPGEFQARIEVAGGWRDLAPIEVRPGEFTRVEIAAE